MNVRRVFIEKRQGFDIQARRLQSDLADFLGGIYPEMAKLGQFRVLRRYDSSGLDERQFDEAVLSVFSEPQCDSVHYSIDMAGGERSFAIEYLPGQYDQCADSAEQCIELITGVRPRIRSATVYILSPGEVPISNAAFEAVKKYLINPVDSREAAFEKPETIEEIEINPDDVPVLAGFITANDTELGAMAAQYGLAMALEDLIFCRKWFSSIKRDPTLAELRVLDTYWSDHCRHTTFNTILDIITIGEGPFAPALKNALALYETLREELYGDDNTILSTHPPSLWDMAVIGAKVLRKRGLADDIDSSKEINACTVKVNAEFDDGQPEPWLLLFKNETHNHPTEIEPFGGAATCLGGAIRDPLSGRAFVHQAMRVTGGADPRTSLDKTMPGKLPQVKIAREAAAGYSSYGNQIGLATGQVAEFYHNGFLAKRMELGAVIAAVPAEWVRREEPAQGDLVILVGGKTGRDGIGGATGSSKVHTGDSVQTAGAEVQKGNAVEERKLQRLFRNPLVTRLVKRCNDFGAGGVSVAVGELADGLDIDLDKVPKKYAGLDGVELAISESQERMAVVVAGKDANEFINFAAAENLDAVVIASITHNGEDASLKMKWRGKTVVDLSRKFLDTNGAPRSAQALLASSGGATAALKDADAAGTLPEDVHPSVLLDNLERELLSLRSGSRRGLQERFDGSIGSASVLFPWGGAYQGTPECGMAALLPSLGKQSSTASILCFGYDPFLMERNPYEGAKGSIRETLAKYACIGGDFRKARLSLQEYFQRPLSPESWGLPASALLGALEAQIALGIPAIGGKDSMSGNYRDTVNGIDITVPPTLVAFAAGVAPAASIRSGALTGKSGNFIVLLAQAESYPAKKANPNLNEWDIFKANMDALSALGAIGCSTTSCVLSAYPVVSGGIAASLALMAFGNNAGLEIKSGAFGLVDGSSYQGSVLVEIDGAAFRDNPRVGEILGRAGCWEIAAITIEEPVFRITKEIDNDLQAAEAPLAVLRRAYEYPLMKVYPQTSVSSEQLAVSSEQLTISNEQLAMTELNKQSLKLSRPDYEQKHCSLLTAHCSLSTAHCSLSTAHCSLPLVLLPVFPGTNCEWDMERAFREAGARTRIVIFRNRNREDIAQSKQELAKAIAECQILALSGGFSAGDEPDGSGKFIANVLRSAVISDAVNNLLENRDGLILGICNGFQALIKLGLVPYGAYRKAEASMPTLTFNRVGRHVSRMVRTLVMPACSPWLALEKPGAVHVLPVSHGEGRLVISEAEGQALFKNAQVPFCYADENGHPTMQEPDNPNGSDFAIEGLCSPDGRILGKMAHSERQGEYVHINIPGDKRQNIFKAGIRYFS
jgi:phosphoribosylformylglycinamidine synthase